MPTKFWFEREDGTLGYRIDTAWETSFRGEEFKSEAEELDAEIDEVLDLAVQLVTDTELRASDASPQFKGNWAFGRAVVNSGVLSHPSLKSEPIILLWQAMAAKARLGIRKSGARGGTDAWRVLRDESQPDETSRGGGVRDKYETAVWLQQHDFNEAVAIFGGDLGNAREIGARTRINVFRLRCALGEWIQSLDEAERRLVHNRGNFQQIAKALRARWPARGPGSARSPEHLPPDQLASEVADVLAPVLADIMENGDLQLRTNGSHK